MNTILHKADTRGTAFFGWLHSRHTFSFGHYYNPERTNFGALRVLNDDIVKGGMGFDTHPHKNMEIVSIPLQGDLEHKDNTGTKEVIKSGDVQIMSAGSGISHSEYNHSASRDVNFLQIWILPEKQNITPRYDQKTFDIENSKNQWVTVVAPDHEKALWINQQAWFSLGAFEAGQDSTYLLKNPKNGIYAFTIDGNLEINGISLNKRDGLGIYETEKADITFKNDSKVLIIEVPMITLQ